MGELFLNSRDWARIGCNDQQIKFLQSLRDSIGTSSTTTSSSITTSIAEINAAIDLLQAESTETQDPPFIGIESQLKRLDHRINELENAQ